jgi:hypothetical protein
MKLCRGIAVLIRTGPTISCPNCCGGISVKRKEHLFGDDAPDIPSLCQASRVAYVHRVLHLAPFGVAMSL